MDSGLRQQIDELRRGPIAQVRAAYRDAFGEEPRSKHREHLVRRVAWRLQVLQQGGLNDQTRERALQIANTADVRVLAPRGFWDAVATPPGSRRSTRWRFDARIPAPGAVLQRDYEGRTVSVKVGADGFEYEGRCYGSLSAIAKQVTGTAWNGLAFFRLAGARRAVKGGRRG